MRALTLDLTSKILEKRLADGKLPRTFAATAIYIINSLWETAEKKTLKEISNAADISEKTVIQCYHGLYSYLIEIVPSADGMLPYTTIPYYCRSFRNQLGSLIRLVYFILQDSSILYCCILINIIQTINFHYKFIAGELYYLLYNAS